MVKCTQESTYTITGLSFEEVEAICMGLDELKKMGIEPEIYTKLIAVIEDGLPDVGEILKE